LTFKKNRGSFLPILFLTLLGFAVMGYHPGAEDDCVYLTAVKADLHPGLFSHDADFFRIQLQATQFDSWMAHFISITRIPVAWAELLWQFAALFLMLWACRSIAARLFPEKHAQWAGVAMVSAMFTLPVAGTALYLADQHLHPRNLATALILLAIARILAGKKWQALPIVLLAIVLHPIMGVLGFSFCFFLSLTQLEPQPASLRVARQTVTALMPLGWVFDPPSPAWRQALDTRTYFFLSRWTWYEWLGAIAPLVLFWLLWRFSVKRGATPLARFALAVFCYGVFQQTVAFIVLGPSAFVRLLPFQPMRFLQLIYVFLCLVGGALLGKYLLQRRVWRWAVFLAVANFGMFYAQRQVFAGTTHLELPFTPPSNAWLEAFDWIRKNTPEDAYFAIDPYYMAAPGEDYHSFRALAERSMLPDSLKDTAVATQVPSLAPQWKKEQEALAGWPHFQLADFERLKAQFGVNWVIVSYPAPQPMPCRWHNGSLSVCRIP
jgi:hypothetical protein